MNSARTSRAVTGQVRSAIATMMLSALAPNSATIRSARKKRGMTMNISVTRISASSTQPSKYPATDPTSSPSAVDIAAATRPMPIEIRAPVRKPAEHVAAEMIGAHQVRKARRLEAPSGGQRGRIERSKRRTQQADEDQEAGHGGDEDLQRAGVQPGEIAPRRRGAGAAHRSTTRGSSQA